jgi:predicted MFS family arabinose efflux permease
LLVPPNHPSTYAHPTRAILILALAPAIGLGIGRFAYSLVLPDMRDSLGWSYSAAGFMNTINAVGYLIGALGAAGFVRRVGMFGACLAGALVCVVSLLVCALTANFTVLSAARLAAGIGAAVTFVGGGTLSVIIAQSQPARSSLLLGLFYTGPATGILVSGLISPFLLQHFGPGSWWIVWAALAGISAVFTAILAVNRIDAPPSGAQTTAEAVPLAPIWIYLAGYFFFGAGYIAYMTFMIAFVRDAGGGALAQSAFWCLLGGSAFASAWIWRSLMARAFNGMSTAILIAITMVGAALPLLSSSPLMLAISAIVFGAPFFGVVTSTTAFVRLNYPAAAWPKAIAVLTVAFGLGQTLGPIATGAITDAMGSLTYALNLSALMLAVGAAACACQRRLPSPR